MINKEFVSVSAVAYEQRYNKKVTRTRFIVNPVLVTNELCQHYLCAPNDLYVSTWVKIPFVKSSVANGFSFLLYNSPLPSFA